MNVRRLVLLALLAVIALLAAVVSYSTVTTRARIDALESKVIEAAAAAAPRETVADWSGLPAPVQRYFEFVFPDGVPAGIHHVEFEMAGDFRRPLTDAFAPTTARQIASVHAPDLVFSAITPIAGPIWAVAYDAYLDGEMEMKARVLSTLTVVDEVGNARLNRVSLRRWLIESPVFPMALLPGGPVRWEPIDDDRARAVVEAHGIRAALVATFRPDGSLERFDAEESGDLETPYHGSGERAARRNYRLVQGVRVPVEFTIARVSHGQVLPFWRGRIRSLEFGG